MTAATVINFDSGQLNHPTSIARLSRTHSVIAGILIAKCH